MIRIVIVIFVLLMGCGSLKSDVFSQMIIHNRTYALQIVVARFIGRWQQYPAAMNRRTTGL